MESGGVTVKFAYQTLRHDSAFFFFFLSFISSSFQSSPSHRVSSSFCESVMTRRRAALKLAKEMKRCRTSGSFNSRDLLLDDALLRRSDRPTLDPNVTSLRFMYVCVCTLLIFTRTLIKIINRAGNFTIELYTCSLERRSLSSFECRR